MATLADKTKAMAREAVRKGFHIGLCAPDMQPFRKIFFDEFNRFKESTKNRAPNHEGREILKKELVALNVSKDVATGRLVTRWRGANSWGAKTTFSSPVRSKGRKAMLRELTKGLAMNA